jgi:hypothetical protein
VRAAQALHRAEGTANQRALIVDAATPEYEQRAGIAKLAPKELSPEIISGVQRRKFPPGSRFELL